MKLTGCKNDPIIDEKNKYSALAVYQSINLCPGGTLPMSVGAKPPVCPAAVQFSLYFLPLIYKKLQ